MSKDNNDRAEIKRNVGAVVDIEIGLSLTEIVEHSENDDEKVKHVLI